MVIHLWTPTEEPEIEITFVKSDKYFLEIVIMSNIQPVFNYSQTSSPYLQNSLKLCACMYAKGCRVGGGGLATT